MDVTDTLLQIICAIVNVYFFASTGLLLGTVPTGTISHKFANNFHVDGSVAKNQCGMFLF